MPELFTVLSDCDCTHSTVSLLFCFPQGDWETNSSLSSEAQGVKCKVRNTDQYDAEVDRFTAGHLTLAGKHLDDTVKYVNTATINTMDIASVHRAVGAANEEKRNTYWDRHQPDW